MSNPARDTVVVVPEPSEQSPGADPKSKRNSGLFAFFKWLKPSGSSRESIDSATSRSSSLDSLSSDKSAGTVASFSFVPPGVYEKRGAVEKCVQIGPETDTYRARLKQRDKRRESDKNVTLRKKYNLFFNRDSLLKPKKNIEEEENSKSLPLMTRAHIMEIEPEKVHRRTNSESSKVKRAGAYVHVKGKRRAPQPPGGGPNIPIDSSSTSSLKRKKRTAPIPPHKIETTENTDDQDKDIVANDYLKLDRGVLKPVKEETRPKTPQEAVPVPGFNAVSPSSSRTSVAEAPVSPRPWYKRNSGSKEVLAKKENKYEPIERLPEVQYMRNSTLDLTLEDSLANPEKDKKKDDKRRSGMSFLTNISELDREASEIIKQKSELEKTDSTTNNLNEIPEFMKPKETKPTNDTLVSSKRRSTRDLIAKFNAITNVTKATVFGISHKDKYFGKQTSLDETKQRQEAILQNHKKRIEEIDKKKEDRFAPLMKSESASAVKLGAKPETPKMDRKSWKCPKCNLENEYWRIICHVCSAIKPYFDDFDKTPETKASSPVPTKKEEKIFERSKTQIGFSALSTYNANKKKLLENNDDCKVDETSKKEEREKLRKMLIEMKNSLPKRKSNILMKQNSRSSIIMENPIEETKKEIKQIEEEKEETNEEPVEKTQEEKVAEILIGTTKTIYQNIKVRKTSNPKPIKVSSEAQTSAVVRQLVPESSIKKLIENHKANNIYEPMKVQDFEDIYSDKNGKSAARLYANLAQNDELSLFFNVPKNISNLKNNLNNQKDGVSSLTQSNNNFNTDTIEINRLLRRLESAIAKGDMTEAAIFAKELAQLKVNCSVIRQKPQGVVVDAGKKIGFQIEMYVEDKVSHRGPFPIDVQESQTVLDLKEQIFREFEIPVDVQRWILGKELVTNDSATLKDHHITEGCPVFLYLVKPEKKASGDQQNPPKSLNASTSKEIIYKNSKNENRLSAKINDIQIPVTVTQLDKNTEEIKTVLLSNKENSKIKDVEDTQHKLVAPKIINVIPKVTEKIPDRVETAKLIPLQKETQKKSSSNVNEKKTSTSTQIPVSVTEIKVDIRPQVSKIPTSRVKEEKTGLVRAKVSEVKVLQAPPITVQSSTFTREVLPKTSKAVLSNGVENGREKIVEISVEVSKNSQQETKSSGVSSKVTGTSTSTNVNPLPKSPRTSSIYPNLSNLDDIGKTDAKVESKEAPKAKEEQDFEEYDSKTLKPPKEWECHLCTLLNPVSSNVCAVCATVRLKRTTLKRSSKKKPAPKPQEQTYLQLVTLDNADLVPNADAFECVVCFLEVDAKQGVTLRECLHQFCRECLSRTVEFAEDAEVKCPYRDEEYSCNIALQDREIKALVSADIYEQHLAKSVAQAENKMEKTFHCKTPDCKGWCIFEDNVNEFKCPVCRRTNCLTCQAIHIGLNCKQYQERMQNEADIDEDAKRTKDFLQEMVEKGEAIGCPTCKVILMKKWGCDWLRCSMCKTEICWVTRGPRWGPAGKGDTSGGCKCGINGVKCHPKCSYCH
ncbi:uncharacterized protein LOC115877061 [Sitophilus oryzae]|uniref:RanBP-type and C3HC4-type zinc finger-containing protein 1 n=1 Tax=Sitophilus oryzae TaxID=7048 RepID=A0A6J2XCM6_SITOR|nr:uncharacterized protein LOC115877061 [Sitophilus oryzae]